MSEQPETRERLAPTPGQTVGPFFAYGVEYPKMSQVVFPHSPGSIVLRGTVTDGNGQAIPDAFIEIFSADTDGSVPRARGAFRRDDHTFTGFGRTFTTDDGLIGARLGDIGGTLRDAHVRDHTRSARLDASQGLPWEQVCPTPWRGRNDDIHAAR